MFFSVIYSYIYCHLQTDCFFVSQLFGMVRQMRSFKLGLKCCWLYASWISYPRAIIILKGIFYAYIFYIYAISYQCAQFICRALHYIFVAAGHSPLKCSIYIHRHSHKYIYLYIYIYIYIYMYLYTCKSVSIYIYIYISLFSN